MTRYSFV